MFIQETINLHLAVVELIL